MRIAVCDDDSRDLAEIKNLLTAYCREHGMHSFEAFSNTGDLLNSMRARPFDILILDVLMPGLTGIEIAKEIRTVNDAVEIIFLSSSPEFAVDSYEVRAYYYLLKPATTKRLYPLLDKIARSNQAKEETLLIRTKDSVFSIPYRSIEYLEINSHTLSFHLTDGSLRQIRGSIAEFAAQFFDRKEFFQVHRSYLINLSNVRECRVNELVCKSGAVVPMARKNYETVRDIYVQLMFREAGRKID